VVEWVADKLKEFGCETITKELDFFFRYFFLNENLEDLFEGRQSESDSPPPKKIFLSLFPPPWDTREGQLCPIEINPPEKVSLIGVKGVPWFFTTTQTEKLKLCSIRRSSNTRSPSL
jgi:hypothetical protein